MTDKLEWHRLVDGDPPRTGWYMVGHGSLTKMVIYYASQEGSTIQGWHGDIGWATHWTKMPFAPRDGTPQIGTPRGQAMRRQADEYTGWDALADCLKQLEVKA